MKHFFKFLAFNIIVIVIFLLLFEIGLRLFWRMSSLKGEIYRKSANKILRYELKPNTKTTYENQEVEINSDGFRNRECTLQKLENTYRIVVLGDSVAFGRFNPPTDNLARRLEVALKKICPQNNFEVLNMGVEGYDTIQEEEMLKVKALKYNPDMVIVYYCLNDPDYPEYYFEKNFFNRHLLFARYVEYKIKKHRIKKDRIRKHVKTDEENISYLYNTECWQYTKKALLEMGDITAARRVKMVLLIFPEMSMQVENFREGFPFWYIIEMLEAVRHPNITVIAPVREFSRRNLNIDELRNWTYPNLKATDIIVDYAIQEIQKHNINFCN